MATKGLTVIDVSVMDLLVNTHCSSNMSTVFDSTVSFCSSQQEEILFLTKYKLLIQ